MADHNSTRVVESKTCPGVQFSVRRMSFGNRIELMKSIREAARELEFRQAGDSIADKLEAALCSAEVDRLYLQWGLARIHNLRVDGAEADTATLIDRGPEELCREIVAEIRRECGLTEEERKN